MVEPLVLPRRREPFRGRGTTNALVSPSDAWPVRFRGHSDTTAQASARPRHEAICSLWIIRAQRSRYVRLSNP